MLSSIFPRRLKDLMQFEGKTEYALTKNTGLSFHSVSDWVKGLHYPDAKALLILADYFKISVDYLLGLDDVFVSVEKNSPTIEKAQKSLIGRLRAYKERKGISHWRLAKYLKVGQSTEKRWFEQGAMPETAILIRISQLLEESLDDLLGRK